MFLDNIKEGIIHLSCNCKCGSSFSLQKGSNWSNEDEIDYFIYSHITEFDAEQRSLFYKITNRLKIAWNIITKGTHMFHEIIISESDVIKLKNSLDKILENED